jgi:hypothetical protein
MISYEKNFDSRTKACLLAILERLKLQIVISLIAGGILMVGAVVLTFLSVTLKNEMLHSTAVALSAISILSTFYCIWVVLSSSHKSKSVMSGTDWRLPGGVVARFVDVDFLGEVAIFESTLPKAGSEHRCSLA